MISETKTMTPAEYLAFERQSDVRHEYDGGELRLMAGPRARTTGFHSISLLF